MTGTLTATGDGVDDGGDILRPNFATAAHMKNVKDITKFGKWKVFRFFSVPEPTEANYNVLETDYENYAIVYSCRRKLFLLRTGKLSIIN